MDNEYMLPNESSDLEVDEPELDQDVLDEFLSVARHSSLKLTPPLGVLRTSTRVCVTSGILRQS
jgi:hypothetical protein